MGLAVYTRFDDLDTITLSVCPSVVLSICPIVSARYLQNRQPFFTRFGVVVYFHKVTCLVEKLVHYFLCRGHSKGLYNQNITIFTMSSEVLVHLLRNLV